MRVVTKRDTERGSGQDRVAAAASLYGWTEVDYRSFDIPSSERAWVKDDLVFMSALASLLRCSWRGRTAVRSKTGPPVIARRSSVL